jgi:tRNA G46 methylase TrmB
MFVDDKNLAMSVAFQFESEMLTKKLDRSARLEPITDSSSYAEHRTQVESHFKRSPTDVTDYNYRANKTQNYWSP